MNKETLFDDKFPEDIKTNKELRILRDSYPDYDPFYLATGAIKERRKKVDKIWNIFKPYASCHFLREYKLNENFNSRTWEMYIGATLIKNNLKIKTSKEDSWPDFIINDSIYLECTACRNASSPNKPDYIPPLEYGKVIDVPREQMIMRITSVIKDKYTTYKKNLNKDKTLKNNPFVIAINSGIFHSSKLSMFPLIYDVLYGLGDLRLTIERSGMKVSPGKLDITQREKIYKYKESKKSPIAVNLFLTDKFKEISAVIFSSQLIINTPNKLGNDCLIIPNPHAKNPIDINLFPFFRSPEEVESKIKVKIF
ncbi:MAG: Uncharacterized protein XD93_0379 [candidate division WS6 bacterium 34_10]|uniref:Uncharacterized protein n=1 Tax=candidate division WS6 bacterium 34_10 TaxID=1641389 RepID=A0A117M0F7_9BACT|nr:MAG: Uncharacterized protein XD93_0379 [candidate division WS6 bacterium 34_10]